MSVFKLLPLALSFLFLSGMTVSGKAVSCDCETALDPTFTWSIDPETCVIAFTADPGDPCLQDVTYYWSINGEPASSSGTNPVYYYENASNIDYVTLKVSAVGEDADCIKSYTAAINDVACFLPDFSVDKQAYRFPNPGPDPLDGVYANQVFEWRITIVNDIQDRELVYTDYFPEGSFPNPSCAFTIQSVSVTLNGVPYPGITVDISDPSNITGTMILPIGTITISFIVRACSDGTFVGQEFENCLEFTITPDIDGVDKRLPPQLRCDELVLRYGCPITMTDGYCISAEGMVQGATLSSSFASHTRFFDIVKIEGDLAYDPTILDTPVFELDALIAPFFTTTLQDNGNGLIHFIIAGIGAAAFDISSPSEGGTWHPFSVNSVLLEDLTECTALYIDNLTFTNSIGIIKSIFIDPGTFCNIFDNGIYESAHIVLPMGENCVGPEGLTLTVQGPFETQHPLTSYLWSTGATTQSIDITSGGDYAVDVVDNEGCRRNASISIADCEPTACDCKSFNPEISFVHNADCSVTATVILPPCVSLTQPTFYWEFSNGNTFTGQYPPPQVLPISDARPEIKLEIGTYINNIKCSKYLEEEVYPCNTLDREANLKIYPNPASKNTVVISIEDASIQQGRVQILNTFGSPLMQMNYNKLSDDGRLFCDVSRLRSGMYLVKFIAKETGTVSIVYLIIE